jgi:uncharacterized protein with von Willebrand factor type A (vWA) domain
LTEDKKLDVIKIVNQIWDRGGTNIAAGMEMAFKTIKDRKYKNPITSIFLLSDGQDS